MTAEPRWPKGVTPALERHALEVLGETPEIKKKALEDLKLLIRETGINSRTVDVFLLRFLRARKYDVQKASRAIVTYYQFLKNQKDMCSIRKPSEIKQFIDMNFTSVHPNYLPGGSVLFFLRVGNFDINVRTKQDFLSTILSVSELLLEHEAAQIVGCTRIFDLKGLTAKHYLQFINFRFLKFVFETLQDVWPERIKAIHFVHEPVIVNALAKVILPLFKKKMRERVHFHGDDLESLHQFVPKEYLPEELGGSMGPFDSKEFAEYFYSHEDFFEEAKTYGLTELIDKIKE